MIIMRGISGSGKSTTARGLAPFAAICSTDNFFMVEGEYRFDPSKLGQYHEQNFQNFCALIRQGEETIVVDNTNTTKKEYSRYADFAKANGYEVQIITISPLNDDGTVNLDYVKQCAERNAHNVPYEVVLRQAERFQI